jgi:hypothetical protein
LALALGVGLAVGESPIAWADDASTASASDSQPSGSPPSTSSATEADPSSDETAPEDPSTAPVGAEDDGEVAEEAPVQNEVPAGVDEPAEEVVDEPAEEVVDEPAEEVVDDPADDVADDPAPNDPAPDDSAPNDGAVPAEVDAVVLAPEVSSDEDDATVGEPVGAPPQETAPVGPWRAAATTPGNAARNTVTQSVSASTAMAALAPTDVVRGFVSTVLSWVGITSQGATSGPSAPVQNPTVWAVLAWLRREINYTVFGRSPHLAPVQTGQRADGEIIGELYGRDFQGQPLTYTGTGGTQRGSVVVVPGAGSGVFIYTPSAEFAANGGVDRFVVTASNTAAYRLDGVAGAVQDVIHRGAQFLGLAQPDTTRVVVEVTIVAGGPTLIGEVRVVGEAVDEPVTSADGSRTYRTIRTVDEGTGAPITVVVVIDTATGKQIGAPVTLAGEPGDFGFSPDGTRIGQSGQVDHVANGTSTTTVVIIDAHNGGTVGAPIVLDGQRTGLLQWSDDGSVAFQATKVFDPVARAWTTSVVVISADGTTIGEPIRVAGSPVVDRNTLIGERTFEFNADGTRAYLTVHNMGSGVDATIPEKTRVAVIDTATWALVGDPIVVDGLPSGSLVFSADGTRVFRVTTVDIYFTGTAKTKVAVLDAVTGQLIGDPVTLDGFALTDSADADGTPVVRFSPDGTRAYVSTNVWDPATFDDTTHVAVIDVADGSLIGTPVILQGRGRGNLHVSAQNSDRLYQLTVTRFATGTQPSSVQMAVIDAVTGTLVGTVAATGLDDAEHPLQFNADGTRAYLVTVRRPDAYLKEQAVTLTVIDAATGTRVGAPLTYAGEPVGGAAGAIRVSADGTRAYQVQIGYDAVKEVSFTRVVVLNTADGSLVRATELAGRPVGEPQLSEDGTRLYQTTRTGVAILDAATGAVIGTAAHNGTAEGPMQFSGKPGDVGYVTITKEEPGTNSATTSVSVIETSVGRVLSTWAVLNGSASGTPIFSADGTRAYRLVSVRHPASDTYTTVVATFDTATGTLIGTPIAMSGEPHGPLTLTADGTRLVQTIARHDPFTDTWFTDIVTFSTGADATDSVVLT